MLTSAFSRSILFWFLHSKLQNRVQLKSVKKGGRLYSSADHRVRPPFLISDGPSYMFECNFQIYFDSLRNRTKKRSSLTTTMTVKKKHRLLDLLRYQRRRRVVKHQWEQGQVTLQFVEVEKVVGKDRTYWDVAQSSLTNTLDFWKKITDRYLNESQISILWHVEIDNL